MKTRRVVLSIFKTCIALAIAMVVIMMLLRFSTTAYDFGFRIFSESPMSDPPGYTMSVAIVEGKSTMEIGKILEDKGLIRNAYLFYLQEFVSNYHGLLKPGVYALSTAMTPDEMMAIMAEGSSIDNEGSDDSYINSELQNASASGNEAFDMEADYEGTDELPDEIDYEEVIEE